MRHLLIVLLAVAAAESVGGYVLAQGGPNAGPAVQAGVTPDRAPSGQPPFGGTFNSRLQRLGADADTGVKRGWWTERQGELFAIQIKAISDDAAAARDRNRGELSKDDTRRLQDRITALHQRMTDLAAQKGKKEP
jgi:hypothetical protein